ncbi:MAG: hypothetical protein K2L02_01595 [Clostridia bacterium]|nr:hypothetical protein [Clostridia bacterium]
MDKVLEKLGIYDLLGVLLSGLIMTVTTVIICYLINCYDFTGLLSEYIFIFIVISYIIGLIFQEVSSLIDKQFFHRNGKLLRNALRPNERKLLKTNHNFYFEDKERNDINEYVVTKLGLETHNKEEWKNDNIVYNYCKNYMIAHKGSLSGNHDQALAAMARSISLYCFLVAVFCPFSIFIGNINWLAFGLTEGIAALLSVIFYYRFLRFSYRRYLNIYRYFLYHCLYEVSTVKKESNTKTSC